VTGLVDQATLARMSAEPDRPLQWQPGADPTVAAVVGERFGEQVVTRSVDPMLSGVYAGSATTIGIRSAVPTVAAALDAGADSLTAAVRRALPGATSGPVFGAVAGGYRVLVEELISRAAVEWVPTAVDHMYADFDGWTVADGTDQTWRADGVVVAVPAPQTAAILEDIAPRSAAAAGRIAVASSVVLAMAVPAGTPFPPQSGVLVATGEGLHSKAITLSTRKWGRSGDAELLRMSFGRFGDEIARSASDEQLMAWAVQDLDTVFGIAVDPVSVMMHRWIDALPQYGPDHAALAAEVRGALPPGLAVAGNFLDGVGVPACVSAGGRAADVVVAATGT
jgi:oxygen-dependent protoporphyrinogen oxidase